MTKQSKIFVLDTNVILHDYNCIHNFQDNDVVIPIVVIEELDKFKSGNDQINYNAREFARELDKIVGDKIFNGGVSLGEGMGNLRIELGKPFSEVMKESFSEDTPDHRILAVACYVAEHNPKRKVIVVSKDINLRIKAKSLGILAEDYLNDKVQNIEIIKIHGEILDDVSPELISELYEKEDGLTARQLKINPYANQFFILKSGESSALAYYNGFDERVKKIVKHKAYGIEARNSEQAFALNALMRPEVKLVALTGVAGTGKTLLALAAALAQEEEFDQIMLARPVIPLQNQEIGFLPGDINEKIGPYMLPLFDNLAVIKNKFKRASREYLHIEEMQKAEKLTISPLAYIRGRSLSRTFFIIDEAQNLTPHEIKTIITRAGEGTKMVFTGDVEQIDSPYLDVRSNGLSYLSAKMFGQDVFAHINLIKGERSQLAELAGKLL